MGDFLPVLLSSLVDMVFLKYFNEAVTSFILLLPLVAGTQNVSNSLPTVDLGYEVYRAADFNVRLLNPIS